MFVTRTQVTLAIREYVNKGGVGTKESAPPLFNYLTSKLGDSDEVKKEITLYMIGVMPDVDTESREPVEQPVESKDSQPEQGGNPAKGDGISGG